MKKLLLLFALVLTVCSTAIAEDLNNESAVGTIGTLDGREAMVVDLGGSIGKVAIATMNVGATNVNDYGTPFSAEDALDSDKNGLTDGWYVPSREELVALSENIKDNDDVIENNGEDLALSLAGRQYVTMSDAICNITANQDPNNKANYYSTFYSRKKAYSVPEGVTAYTGAVDGSVLKLTAIESGIIPAGEAVILRLTTENNTATKKQFDLTAMTTTATKSGTNALTGTDVATTLGASDYALSLGQNGVGFYLWEGKSIDAHKAYLYMGDSAAGTKALGFEFED